MTTRRTKRRVRDHPCARSLCGSAGEGAYYASRVQLHINSTRTTTCTERERELCSLRDAHAYPTLGGRTHCLCRGCAQVGSARLISKRFTPEGGLESGMRAELISRLAGSASGSPTTSTSAASAGPAAGADLAQSLMQLAHSASAEEKQAPQLGVAFGAALKASAKELHRRAGADNLTNASQRAVEQLVTPMPGSSVVQASAAAWVDRLWSSQMAHTLHARSTHAPIRSMHPPPPPHCTDSSLGLIDPCPGLCVCDAYVMQVALS